MCKYKFFVLILFVSIILGMNLSFATTKGIRIKKDDSLYKAKYALLIGVSRYTAGWPSLSSIPKEINEIETALNRHGFKVTKVMDPTSVELYNAFNTFINQYGFDENNGLLFFFSGHGHTRERGQRSEMGYVVPADAPDPNVDDKGFVQKSLEMAQIITWAKRIESKHTIFVFDSCFSGAIFETKSLPEYPAYIPDLLSYPVRQFITAGSADETVPSNSVFSPLFIRALDGEGDLDGDGYITGSELGTYIHRKILSYGVGQTPQYGKIRDPELDRGDFIFKAAQGFGFLSVESNLPGAIILADGKKIGTTPIQNQKISEGKHIIEVRKKGYSTYARRINLKRGASIALPVILMEISKSRLVVKTEPENAVVKIINKELSQSIEQSDFRKGVELESGEYRLEISADGYDTKRERITIAAGKDESLEIHLTPLTGILIVQSTPSGAECYLDNQYISLTPCKIRDVAKGTHRIDLKMAGYADWKQSVVISADKDTFLTARLRDERPSNGSLSVKTYPDGAYVYLNNQYAGKTPCEINNLEKGEYAVEIRKHGYENWRQTHMVQAGINDTITARLAEIPKISRLFVKTNPEDAAVKLLNANLRFYQGMELQNGGVYQLEVSASGYETQQRRITINPGEDAHVDVRLARIQDTSMMTGGISVQSAPEGAIWYFEGRYRGATPGNMENLKQGRYTVVVKKDGYEDWTRLVTISPGETVSVEARLNPEKSRRRTKSSSKLFPVGGF